MPKKMTIEDVKKILPTLEILSDVYIYAHANLCYKCECGEIHEAYYSNLAAGKRHDFCKHKQNLRDEQKYIKLKSMMEKEGYKLLGVKFEGRDGKTDMQCPNEHITQITYDHFCRGVRCGQCFRDKNRGPNHPSYVHEMTDEDRNKNRCIPGYSAWVRAVIKRYNGICQCCFDDTCDKLEAHHMYAYAKFKEYRTMLFNGRALCSNCHKEFHQLFGRGRNDIEDFGLFLQYKNSIFYKNMIYLYYIENKHTENNMTDLLNSLKVLKELETLEKLELKEGREYLPLEKREDLELSELISITSSNVARVGYTTNGNLLVMFNNKKEYLYSEVPREVYESLKKADSVGSELNKTIKGKFKFTALE